MSGFFFAITPIYKTKQAIDGKVKYLQLTGLG